MVMFPGLVLCESSFWHEGHWWCSRGTTRGPNFVFKVEPGKAKNHVAGSRADEVPLRKAESEPGLGRFPPNSDKNCFGRRA